LFRNWYRKDQSLPMRTLTFSCSRSFSGISILNSQLSDILNWSEICYIVSLLLLQRACMSCCFSWNKFKSAI
jgi:hypothetical protein